jgi:predicted transcriptional regulator
VFIGGTEVGKYRFLMLFVPLYSRIKKEEVLDHFLRGRIFEFIRENPGEHYNIIKKELGLKNGSLAYHLNTLEKEDYIKSKRDGMYKRFYPKNMEVPAKPKMRLSPVQQNIFDVIKISPKITQKDIAEALKISQQVVSYHVNQLIELGVLRSERVGNTLTYYIEKGDL